MNQLKMAYINLPDGLPGIRGLLAFRPETAIPLNELAEALLRDNNNTLTRGERELIATYVSYLNDCFFCQNAHGAIAQHYLQCDMVFLDGIKIDMENSSLPARLKMLLAIASAVQQGGKSVTEKHIRDARESGATDGEIHDAVLIAAAFCMFNRYVDGLGTSSPEDRNYYIKRGKRRAEEGYLNFDLNQ